MRPAKNEICPKCGSQGFGLRQKEVKRWSYSYFGHRIKKDNRWTIRWCYLGKLDSVTSSADTPTFTPMSEYQEKLGNKLGNIEQNFIPNQHNISSSGQIEVEISPKPYFDKSFQFT